MTGFNEALKRILAHEGGYVNHPDDKGGETMNGITIAVAREHGYKGDMAELPFDVTADIYFEKYWRPVHGPTIMFHYAFQMFDAAVNHGVSRAIKFAQQAVDDEIKVDGIMGPVTCTAISCTYPADFVARFNACRMRYYTDLSNFDSFGKGWMRRVAENLDYGAKDVAARRMISV